MKLAVIATVFLTGFITGHIGAPNARTLRVGVDIVQAERQATPRLPAERVTGIGGIFMMARDPKALASTTSFMINYRVNNLDGLLARLRAAGVTIEGKVVEDFNGKFDWVMDPEGNKIELWEPKPGF